MPLLSDFSDTAALAESKRLSLVILARRTKLDDWTGLERETITPKPSENSGFTTGMLTLFRYARGEDVPATLVRSFLDDLLELMFCGLASPEMALPSFSKMGDRPWAHAWRAAEIRLVVDEQEPVETPTLAHLLCIPSHTLARYLMQNGMAPSYVPAEKLKEVTEFFTRPGESRCAPVPTPDDDVIDLAPEND